MRYRLTLNFEGPVDGAAVMGERRMLTLAGSGQPPESSDLWRLAASITWPASAEGRPEQAEFTLSGPLEGLVGGTFRDGVITAITDDRGVRQADRLDLLFAIVESSGAFRESSGTVRLTGTVERQGFRISAQLDLDAPDGAWTPPNARLLTDRELASGASPVGPQPLTQQAQEREAEASLRRARCGN